MKSKKSNGPNLINARSPYGHRATPLHYACANGTETRRQQVPLNLPEVIEFLVANGVGKTATTHVYGQDYTPLKLLTTSAHPYAAGVGKKAEQWLQG